MLGEGFFLCVAFGLERALLRWGRRLRATRRPDYAIRLTAGPGSVASAIRGLPPVVTRSVDPLVMAVLLRSPDCRAVLGRIRRSFNHVPVERASTVSKASRSRAVAVRITSAPSLLLKALHVENTVGIRLGVPESLGLQDCAELAL